MEERYDTTATTLTTGLNPCQNRWMMTRVRDYRVHNTPPAAHDTCATASGCVVGHTTKQVSNPHLSLRSSSLTSLSTLFHPLRPTTPSPRTFLPPFFLPLFRRVASSPSSRLCLAIDPRLPLRAAHAVNASSSQHRHREHRQQPLLPHTFGSREPVRSTRRFHPADAARAVSAAWRRPPSPRPQR